MWLVVALALAADPPAPAAPAAPPPATAAPADAPRGGAALRRTCEGAQLCEGRCIPWSEACSATLRDSVNAQAALARKAELAAIVCAPSPFDPAAQPASIEAEILTQAAAGFLCDSERRNDPEACDPDPATRDVPPPRPVTRPPICQQAPPIPKK
ncbi:MAG: hypothetical protein Q8P41_28445 [Pseudomonadota bacterium]|nr:hypothetical protein [Pseudomonadota bacterium]